VDWQESRKAEGMSEAECVNWKMFGQHSALGCGMKL